MTQFDDGRIHLPPAVRKKIAEGEAAFQQQFEQPATETPPVVQEAIPPQEPLGGEEEQHSEDAPVVVQEQALGDTTIEELEAQLTQANHRFATLQGRYRADMDRQQRQFQDVQRQLNEALAQVTALSNRVLENSGGNDSSKKRLTDKRRFVNITDAERADFGDGFFDMLARATGDIIEQEVAARLGQLPTSVETLTARLDQSDRHQALTKQERREQWLDANLSGWRTQDEDPGFLSWLREEDAFSGVPRLQILSHAMDRDDYPRIKKIFEGYAEELGITSPGKPPRQATARARLQAQAMPNGGNGRVDAIVPNAPEAPPTPEEIRQFYDRKIRKPKSLTEAEIAQMEARIARGLAAGTIRGVPRV